MHVSIPPNFNKKKIPKNRVRALVAEVVGYYIHRLELKQVWKLTEGEGVGVCVIDTGAPTHYDSLVHEKYSFVPNEGADDENDHGSHVTGIINAQHNIIGIKGISPRVYMVSKKGLDRTGRAIQDWIDDALKAVLERDDIHIVNLSIGSAKLSQRTKTLFRKLYDKGIAVFVAAGNWGNTLSNAYATPYTFSVTAIDRNNRPASFSSVAEENDFAAYGVDIVSFGAGQSEVEMDGTSMACPVVAACAALVQAYAISIGQQLSPQDLYDLLKRTAKDVGAEGFESKTGWGLVQPLHAIRDLQAQYTNIPVPVEEIPSTEQPAKEDQKVMKILFGQSL